MPGGAGYTAFSCSIFRVVNQVAVSSHDLFGMPLSRPAKRVHEAPCEGREPLIDIAGKNHQRRAYGAGSAYI